MTVERDLIGYGMNPPQISWPGGARLAVQMVINYEEGSEYSLQLGDSHREVTGDTISPIPLTERDLLLSVGAGEDPDVLSGGRAGAVPTRR